MFRCEGRDVEVWVSEEICECLGARVGMERVGCEGRDGVEYVRYEEVWG